MGDVEPSLLLGPKKYNMKNKPDITPLDKHFLDKKALTIIKACEFPLEVLLVKHLADQCDIKSEEELVALLETAPNISQVMKVKLQNGYRDVYTNNMYKANKIPNIFR